MSFELIETIQVGLWTHQVMACAARCIFVIKLYLLFIKFTAILIGYSDKGYFVSYYMG